MKLANRDVCTCSTCLGQLRCLHMFSVFRPTEMFAHVYLFRPTEMFAHVLHVQANRDVSTCLGQQRCLHMFYMFRPTETFAHFLCIASLPGIRFKELKIQKKWRIGSSESLCRIQLEGTCHEDSIPSHSSHFVVILYTC